MSDIVLTASVRQNLLSLQSTADLLATTQNRLATGKKVNSALDNPTNYFTAASLDARASDINNLLDGIGNGVQVLQAANTGITSLQKLIDSAKSIANQALQTNVGYTKSAVTTGPNAGATGANLLGPVSYTSVAAPPGAAMSNGLTSPTAISATSVLSGGSTTVDGLASAITTADSFTVNGKTISFVNTGAGDVTNPLSGNVQIDLGTVGSNTVGHLLSVIDTVAGNTGTGSVASTVSGTGQLQLNTGINSDLTIGGNAATLAKLGLSATNNATRTPVTALGGLTLTIDSTSGGAPTNIVFGTGTGQVSTINQLNAALLQNNLQASIDSTGAITITTSNDAAASTIGTIGGTATVAGKLFAGLTPPAPVPESTSQATRASLVAQYNNVIQQIKTTSQDASFNGVNLLNGDQLKLIFNETGKSTLNITGINLDPAGLGLGTLTAGTDFVDNVATNKVLDALNFAGSFLRSQASTLGSNLSIVQIRQDFSKQLINVLQTGSTNLTIADTNEEAANSQALSTRQSIAVSALALANQSQQSVLKLLQ